jgi:type II secretory pathway component PulM
MMKEKTNGLFSFLSRLTASEKRYLIVLLLIVVVGGAGWFVVVPAFNNLQDTNAEIDTLAAQKSQYEQQIATTIVYERQYQEANDEYKKYQQFFFPNMPPEAVDERVTSLLKEHGLDPKRLSMTALQLDELPAYEAQPLVPGAVPEGEGANDDTAAAGEAGADAGDNGAGTITEYPAGELPAYDGTSVVYVYTVDILADCTAEELFSFIEAVNANPAIEMTTFNFKEPESADEDGSVAIQIKIYVFFGVVN